MIKQKTNGEKNNKSTVPEAKISNREKMKEEPIQRMANLPQNHNFVQNNPFKQTCRPEENYKRKLRKVNDTENTTIEDKCKRIRIENLTNGRNLN